MIFLCYSTLFIISKLCYFIDCISLLIASLLQDSTVLLPKSAISPKAGNF
nr:MAG TPA: hypothetical protein [Bacteriophage sp.]